MAIVELKIHCPLCGRRVTPVTGYDDAIDVVKRRCPTGHRWVVKVTPCGRSTNPHGQDVVLHRLDWVRLDPWTTKADKDVTAKVHAGA